MENKLNLADAIEEFQLIQEISNGRLDQFEILIRRYNSVLYKIARCYGFGHHDAEDLMQESWIAAYKNLGSFENRSSFKTWVSKIMVHKCIYKLNYGSYKKEIPGSEQIREHNKPVFMNGLEKHTEKNLEGREFKKLLEQTLEAVPLNYRTVFILREIEGFSVQESAELLGISAVNVKVRLNRAKTILREKLESYYQHSGLYEFNLVYCDGLVARIFDQLKTHQ
jgi:RNA polymerase sigma-70 factor (ECF subfamily)